MFYSWSSNIPADPVAKVRETLFYRCAKLHDSQSKLISLVILFFPPHLVQSNIQPPSSVGKFVQAPFLSYGFTIFMSENSFL